MTTIPPDGTLVTPDHLTRVQLHPGDILVCTVPHRLSNIERDEIESQLRMIAPANATLLLDNRITLAVLQPVKAQL